MKLTESQRKVLEFIRAHLDRHGFPPTQAEIAKGLGYRSPNAAASHLRLLEKKGALTIVPHVSRGIRLTSPDGIPVVGDVAAGRPILAEEHVEQRLQIPPSLFRPHADYLLRVRGDSMSGVGILSGDLVAVHRRATMDDGRIAVVRIEDEVTIKRWRRPHPDTVVLEAENPDYDAMVVDATRTRVAIEGLVVGLLRLDAAP